MQPLKSLYMVIGALGIFLEHPVYGHRSSGNTNFFVLENGMLFYRSIIEVELPEVL